MFPYGVVETLHKKMETEQRWGTKEAASCHAREGSFGGNVVESFSLKSANGVVSTTRACDL